MLEFFIVAGKPWNRLRGEARNVLVSTLPPGGEMGWMGLWRILSQWEVSEVYLPMARVEWDEFKVPSHPNYSRIL